MAGSDFVRLIDLYASRNFVRSDSPLTSVFEAMKTDGTPYRAPVVDSDGKFVGMINKRRILEVLIGTRGSAIRGKEGSKSLMDEPVFILIDESHQVFEEESPIKMVLDYMGENSIGYIVVVDQNNSYRGMVEEQDILRHMVGRRLETPVGGLMKKNVIGIPPETPIYEAATIMVQKRVRRLPVEAEGKLRGILTIGQVVEHIFSHIQRGGMELEGVEVMPDLVEAISNKNAHSCLPSTELGEAIGIMLQKNISGMPVTEDGGRVVGMFTRVDAMAALVHGLGADRIIELMG